MKTYLKNIKLLEKNHVYRKSMEHDACGVGLIASTEGKKSRKIVEYGIEALKAVWHRGAVDADGKTGDGAGIHLEIPTDFFSEKIEITGHKHDKSQICVGMIFLPRNNFSAQEVCRTLVETELTKSNFSIYGWRQVPVNTKVLGEKANQNRPEITQVLFKHNKNKIIGKELERKLYESRRKIEKEANKIQLDNFYICSLSSKSIIYKGMFLAESLSDFYPDLKDERFVSRYVIFHQRFSTNTFPSWSLAQPFRAIAHNGEINTFKGNINWMKVHEEEMDSQLFEKIENLKPVIQPGVSDSAALDNVLLGRAKPEIVELFFRVRNEEQAINSIRSAEFTLVEIRSILMRLREVICGFSSDAWSEKERELISDKFSELNSTTYQVLKVFESTIRGKKSIPGLGLLIVAVISKTLSLYLIKTDPLAALANSPVSIVIFSPSIKKSNLSLSIITP